MLTHCTVTLCCQLRCHIVLFLYFVVKCSEFVFLHCVETALICCDFMLSLFVTMYCVVLFWCCIVMSCLFVVMWRCPSCTHLISLAMSSSLSLLLLRTNHRQRMRRKMKPNTEPNVAPTIIPAFVANSRNHGTHNCYISTSHILHIEQVFCRDVLFNILNTYGY